MKETLGLKSKTAYVSSGIAGIGLIGISIFLFFTEFQGDINAMENSVLLALFLLGGFGLFSLGVAAFLGMKPHIMVRADTRGLYLYDIGNKETFLPFKVLREVEEHRRRSRYGTLSTYGHLSILWENGKKVLYPVGNVVAVRDKIMQLWTAASKYNDLN